MVDLVEKRLTWAHNVISQTLVESDGGRTRVECDSLNSIKRSVTFHFSHDLRTDALSAKNWLGGHVTQLNLNRINEMKASYTSERSLLITAKEMDRRLFPLILF